MTSPREQFPARQGHALETEIRRLSGARAVRVVDGGGSVVDEHSHDWPILSLFVAGDYTKLSDAGERRICSPAAVLHAPSAAHANVVSRAGIEQLDIEFDPAWIGLDLDSLAPVRVWAGGPVASVARSLISLWNDATIDEAVLAANARDFLEAAFRAPEVRRPPWLEQVLARIREETPPSTVEIAADLGLNAAWMTAAYRAAMGEGLAETQRRYRVEAAAALLRGRAGSPAEIAVEVGFCDQSHMIRAFRAVLGRTPGEVAVELAARAA